MSRGGGKWTLLAAVSLVGLAADQLTKFLAVDRLTSAFQRAGAHDLAAKLAAYWRLHHLEPLATEPYYVYRPLWRMSYVENPAAAFSMFRMVPPDLRYAIFLGVSAVAVVFVFFYYRRLDERSRLMQLALALVLAGTVGNLVDRLARRYVIDFVEWYWWKRPDLIWPTFNVADALLVTGIALLLVVPTPRPAGEAGSLRSAGRRGALPKI